VSVPAYLGSRRLSGLRIALVLLAGSTPALAGGPRYVAGVTYFNAGTAGQPIHWAGGQLNYFVDQGPLSATVNNQQATAMVDAAAALWSAVPTAGVTLTDMGPLNEDVNGSNIAAVNGTIAQPADVTPSATNYPVGVIYDADGSVIDAIFGAGSSWPERCQDTGVFMGLDNINPDTTIAHGIIVLNGRCATNANLLAMMSFQLERAFGRILGLDDAQVNPNALTNGELNGTLGWPVMQPQTGLCGDAGGACIPDPGVLRWDDIAALNRIYPITTANTAAFPGKVIAAANTVSIQGTVSFTSGLGMQGVNVVARPLDANGNPLYQYTVTFVSGGYFSGNHGSPVTGFVDQFGNPLSQWGSENPAQQGFFDLSGIPLPPGVTKANYQVTFEAVNPAYTLAASVGPYIDGSPAPSGTLAPIAVRNMQAGSVQTLTVAAANSAIGGEQDPIGTQAQPRMMPASGMWSGRLSQIGQSDWLIFPVRAGSTFTVVTQAVDETGTPSNVKAMPAIGVWDAFAPVGASPAAATPALNSSARGVTQIQASAPGDDVIRLGIADQRGDGRPDYAYVGWVLYAGMVSPARLPASGGAIVIDGMGFHLNDTVLVGGRPAVVTSITPNEISAIAPPAQSGVTGSVKVEIDDPSAPNVAAILSGSLSYDAGTGDALTLVTAPMNVVPIGVPIAFSVIAQGPTLAPAGGVTVLYTVTSGDAKLTCGSQTCSVTATGDGRACINVTAIDGAFSTVIASLANGASLEAGFSGGAPPSLAAITPQLSLAAGAKVTWTVQTLALQGGVPLTGQTVTWQSASGIAVQGSASAITGASGMAAMALTVGPLAEGQLVTASACINGTSQCVTFTAFGARPEFATVVPIAGTTQSLSVSGTPAQIALRALDMDGNPMAGANVNLYQALYAWAPPCPRHGRCAQTELLATQTATASSALDGTVSFTPASLPGIATSLYGLAATGNTSSVNIAIEQHP